MTRLGSLLLAAGITILTAGSLAAQSKVISMQENQNVLEFVGQFNNTATTSQQFGYVSRIEGLEDTFNAAPQNEASALFTFVTNATTDRVIANGPFRIVNRTGTTTIYLNTPPSLPLQPPQFLQPGHADPGLHLPAAGRAKHAYQRIRHHPHEHRH